MAELFGVKGLGIEREGRWAALAKGTIERLGLSGDLAVIRSDHRLLPHLRDYRLLIVAALAEPKGETVLFHGYHAGNFVYHVRVADRERRAIVLRSDKLFGRVRRLGHAEERFEPMVATAEEVAELLTAHGVGYVVIEPNGHSAASAVEPLLRDAVSRPPWRLSAEVPVASHLSKPGEGEILVYENPEAGRATAEAIPFWVPLSERTLRVTYEALRRDRQGSGRP